MLGQGLGSIPSNVAIYDIIFEVFFSLMIEKFFNTDWRVDNIPKLIFLLSVVCDGVVYRQHV